MEGQKTENLLNLALDATQEEREKSLELEVGYHPEEREWDLIIKYSGDLEGVRGIAARTTKLLNEYAVVTVAESRIQELAALPEVEYVEKPKRLYFQMEEGKRVSCINEVQDARFSLLGQGVPVSYTHLLPPEAPYYQRASAGLDIYGFGRTLQYLLAEAELEPRLTGGEERKFRKVISRCLERQSKQACQTISEIPRCLPEPKEKKEWKWRPRKVLAAVAALVALAALAGLLRCCPGEPEDVYKRQGKKQCGMHLTGQKRRARDV